MLFPSLFQFSGDFPGYVIVAQLTIIEARSRDYKGGHCGKDSSWAYRCIGEYLEQDPELILSGQNSDQNTNPEALGLHVTQEYLLSQLGL